MRPAIFVSYSRRDSALVTPVVALLRASEALVFRDADGLKPGKRWREQLSTAIEESKIVLVFWCHHAHDSEEVCKEYAAAISLKKDVLPVLIDETPLPPELAEYQCIDFREAFAHGHDGPRLLRRPLASNDALIMALYVFCAMLGMGIVWELLKRSIISWLEVSALLLLLGMGVRLYLKRSSKVMYREATDRPRVEEFRLAAAIGAELRRRTSAGDP